MNIEAKEIIDKADEQTERWRNHVRPVANWFHDREGTIFTRSDAVSQIANDLDISEDIAKEAVTNIVSDTVDPVVQIRHNGRKYVGIVEYNELDGAYGYMNFDDVRGKEKRVVCAQCVKDSEHDTQVTHATAGDPNGSFDNDANYSDLVNAIHNHYDEAHKTIPENVETGATLASGTTIGGNTAFHAGNDGSGSGLDADTLRGNTANDLTSPADPFYSDGSDGSITRSSNTTENRYITATDYTVNSGVTVSVDSFVFILATNSITIDGTIDANGAGAAPATNSGSLLPRGPGGAGGKSAGDGGDGDISSTGVYRADQAEVSTAPIFDALRENINAGASGGNGGAGFAGSNLSVSNDDGEFPGGGGGRQETEGGSTTGSGGSGGAGGGLVYLAAPNITINGSVTADGLAGEDGENADAAGGGGGGGSGGIIMLLGQSVSIPGSTSVSAGSGGFGPSGGGDGANGEAGEVIINSI